MADQAAPRMDITASASEGAYNQRKARREAMNRTASRNSQNGPPPLEEALSLRERFRKFAYQVASGVGSPAAFVISCLLLIGWLVSGPFFHFSDTWQLIINTATTIVTFLMVFLIQNT